jgi:hypothetical protein
VPDRGVHPGAEGEHLVTGAAAADPGEDRHLVRGGDVPGELAQRRRVRERGVVRYARRWSPVLVRALSLGEKRLRSGSPAATSSPPGRCTGILRSPVRPTGGSRDRGATSGGTRRGSIAV